MAVRWSASVPLALLLGVLAACAASGVTSPRLEDDADAALDANAREAGPAALCATGECPPGYADCNGDPADGCEVNVASSADNCGVCGVRCGGEGGSGPENTRPICKDGKCALECKGKDLLFTTDGTWASCGGPIENGCKTRISCDVDNCGGCGVRCAAGEPCYGGTCGCPAGTSKCGDGPCGGSCFDLQKDPNHCGSCAKACSASEPWASASAAQREHAAPACKAGACAIACEKGWGHCSTNPTEQCETRLDTDANCGQCGNVCPTGQSCRAGKCGCAPGETLCDGACRNLALDVENCGACNTRCAGARAGGHGKPACNGGTCTYDCDPLFADCNASPIDGCETNIGANPLHCGACGGACAADQRCWSGACAEKPCVTR